MEVKKIYDSVIEKTLLLMIISIPISFTFISYNTASIKDTLFQIGTTFIFMTWILKNTYTKKIHFTSKQNLYRLKLILPVLTFFLYAFFLFLISDYKILIADKIVNQILYLSLIFVVLDYFHPVTLNKLHRLFKTLIITTVIVSIYGIFQYLGLDFFYWENAYGDRIFSTFTNPNFFASFLIIGLPIILTYFLYYPSICNFKRKDFSFKFLFSKIFLFLSICILLFCVFASKSKGGILGAMSAMLVFAIIHFFLPVRKKIFIIIIFFLIIYIFISVFGIANFTLQKFASLEYRLLIWKSALRMIIEKPLFGWGIGGFEIFYPLFIDTEIFSVQKWMHHVNFLHAENEFLELLIEGGVIYLSLFVLMMGVVFYSGFKKIINEGKKTFCYPLLAALYSSVSGIIVHNLVGVNLRYVSTGFFFWLFLVLIIDILGTVC